MVAATAAMLMRWFIGDCCEEVQMVAVMGIVRLWWWW